MERFFDVTLAGGAMLLICALFCWSRTRIVPIVALAGLLVVLPATALSCRNGLTADWYNSTHNAFHPSLLAWITDLLPVPLALAALVWSVARLREALRARWERQIPVGS